MPSIRLIPERYNRKTIFIWLGIGLGIRFILMPISFHPDLLNYYALASYPVHHNIFNLARFFRENLNSPVGGFIYLPVYLHAIFLWILGPLLPSFQWSSDLVGWFTTPENYTVALQSFATQPYLHFRLFLLKFPYLLFDIAGAFLLLSMFKDRTRGTFAFKFWMLNFLSLFFVYVWGKYDIIAVFFTLLSIKYALLDKPSISLLFLGMASIIKLYTFFFLIPFIFILGRGRERWKLACFGLLPPILIAILGVLTSPGVSLVSLIDFFELLIREQGSFLLNISFVLGFPFKGGIPNLHIYLFPILYIFGLFYIVYNPGPVKNLSRYSLSILLLFYSICHFHAPYLLWMLPFFLFVARGDRRFIYLHIVQILSFFIFDLRGGLGLAQFFIPLFGAPGPPPQIVPLFSFLRPVILGVARSIFTGASLFMLYLTIKES